MDQEWSVPGWAVVACLVTLTLLVVVLAVALVRSRARSTAAVEAARAEAAVLAAQVEAIARRLDQPSSDAVAVDDTAHVVTMLGRELADDADEPAPAVPGPLFADLVLREGVVQAASLAAGVRRALAPEVRHRIRWEMRREVKRARKQRRADLRQARRDVAARQRSATVAEESAA